MHTHMPTITQYLVCLCETCIDTIPKATHLNLPEAFAYKRFVKRDWKQRLIPNGYTCSACRNDFEASSWNTKMVSNHGNCDRDLL